ncbi:MAG: NADPH-dependent FMN reductase [Alphaproteobacteria bacterium]
MTQIIAFAGSTHKSSINKQLAVYATRFLDKQTVELLDLNDYPLPIYSEDTESEDGFPLELLAFKAKLDAADAFVIATAEHNGSWTAAFKNFYDWLSRLDRNIFGDKNILLLSTSPGTGGAGSSLGMAKRSFPFAQGKIVAEFSLPSFYENFANGKISNPTLNAEFELQVKQFEASL